VIQGLARAGWLPYFHYLSTVSGGGYIGGWLSAWIRRANFERVVAACARARRRMQPEPPRFRCESAAAQAGRPGDGVTPESPQIRWLRAYSNYLSPRLGFSADFWALIAVMLRNLLLHWVVFLPLLAAALMLPRVTVGSPPNSILRARCGGSCLRWPCSSARSGSRSSRRICPVRTGGRAARRVRAWLLLAFLVGAFLLSLFWAWHTRTGADRFAVWTYMAVGVGCTRRE